MSMLDSMFNSRNDPKVIEWRKHHCAASNFLGDLRRHNSLAPLVGVPRLSIFEWAQKKGWPAAMGVIPETPEAADRVMLDAARGPGGY